MKPRQTCARSRRINLAMRIDRNLLRASDSVGFCSIFPLGVRFAGEFLHVRITDNRGRGKKKPVSRPLCGKTRRREEKLRVGELTPRESTWSSYIDHTCMTLYSTEQICRKSVRCSKGDGNALPWERFSFLSRSKSRNTNAQIKIDNSVTSNGSNR